jgi:plastocyanin
MRVRHGLIAALVLVAAACGGKEPTDPGNNTGSTGTGGTGGTGGTSPVATNQVSVSDNSFTPAAIVVTAGTTVTWTWTSATIHNVTFSASGVTGSGDRGGTGEVFSKQFPTVGTFAYACGLHAGMSGSVKVE